MFLIAEKNNFQVLDRNRVAGVIMDTAIKSSAEQDYQLDIQYQKREEDLTSKAEDSYLLDAADVDKTDTVDADLVLVDKADEENEKYSELLKFSFCCLIAASVQIYLLDI